MRTSYILLALGMMLAPPLSAQTSTPPRSQARDRDVITREELVESAQKNSDLFKAVRSLRPHFLRPPAGVRSMVGAGGMAPVQLYVDGRKQAEVNSLVLIQTVDVDEVRYLDPGKAQDLYGITHSGGAILVKLYQGTKTPPPPRMR